MMGFNEGECDGSTSVNRYPYGAMARQNDDRIVSDRNIWMAIRDPRTVSFH